MRGSISTIPAAQVALDTLAEIVVRSFEGYFYTATLTAESLARRIRLEQIDLWHSQILLADQEPIGIALLAIRDQQAWCGGFGIYTHARGHGYAHTLANLMVTQARQSGASLLGLEVLTRNHPAIRVYQQTGMRSIRDLQILEWRRSAAWQPVREVAIEADPPTLLADFARLHPVTAAWQRDLPTLLIQAELQGLAIERHGTRLGYLLYQRQDASRVRICDLATLDPSIAQQLLQALQNRAETILSINEPTDNPATAAFATCGFTEIDRQHEMLLQLAETR